MKTTIVINVPASGRKLYNRNVVIPTGARVKITDESKKYEMLILRNNSDSVVFIGDQNVDSQNGFPVLPKEVFVLNVYQELYAYAEDNDVDLRIMEG